MSNTSKNNCLLEQDKSEKIESDCSEGHEDEEETGNLFRLSVLFVRGSPFDSQKHWRMRSSFLDANLKIGSLGRIREVDERFLDSSEKETSSVVNPLPRRGVRLIEVQPKENNIMQQEPVQAKVSENFELPKECYIEEHCRYSPSDFVHEPDCITGGYQFDILLP